MFPGVAYAMGGFVGAEEPGGIGAFLPLILMFVVFYFLLIWPQQKKAKAHKQVLSNLQKGDNVVTSSGIYGIDHRHYGHRGHPGDRRESPHQGGPQLDRRGDQRPGLRPGQIKF